jgi:hypothetical protein
VAKTLKRIDLGFEGGQILSARVEKDAYETLHKALAKGDADRWHQLDTADADIAIDLSKVVYLRVDTEERGVGF